MSEVIDCISFIVRKTCWSLWKFTEFVGKRLLDLIGLVFNILACLTVVRLPCMIQQFCHMKTIDEWRLVGLVQFLIFLMDIPVILMGFTSVILTLGFILVPFIKKVKKKKVKCDYTYEKDGIYFGGFKLRAIVVSYFARVICDVFCVPLGLMCFCSWRGPTLIRKIKKQKHWEDLGWRRVCIVQFLHLLADIPCLICGALLMVTWRGPYLIYLLYKRNQNDNFTWNIDRFEVFLQLFLLVTDIFFLVMFLVTVITWRGPLLIHDLANKERPTCINDDDDEECIHVSSDWIFKYKIAKHAALIFVDIPCIICAILVMITLYRLTSFMRNCTKDEWELRVNCLKQFVLLIIDIAFLLLNIFCLILTTIVIATLWRVYPLIRDLKKYFKQRSEIPKQTANETKEEKYENKERRNKNSWKIRKAVLKHFGFLLIDIPAIVGCVVILVTMARFPKLLSKLVQAGDFYMEFALTTFSQLIKLIVDIVFLLLFIVLMIMRPVQSWVHLLEDEEHRKTRLLRFYMQWMPDILEERHSIYRKLEEVFSQSLKNKCPAFNVRVELSIINAEFLNALEWIRSKVKKYELDGHFGHLLQMVQFYEGKRAYKLQRLYLCELNYLHCANASVHNENLTKYRNEMIAFESKVESFIRELKEFKVKKVQLWANECGLRTRTRRETQHVLIKCLPSGWFILTILMIVNFVLIYRGPALIRKLCRRWYDRKRILFSSLREYLKDFLTLLIILTVLLTVYRAPFLLTEIANDVISKRSWNAVRKTVRRYPPKFFQDLVDLIVTLFSWNTIRFVFTAILFGLLMPADLFLKVMKFAFKNTFLAIISTITLYALFFGFPFVLTFKIAPVLIELFSGSGITTSIGAFGVLLVVFLIIASVLTFRHRENTFSVRPKAYDYVRFNWTNAHVLIFEVIEFLQLLALVFVVSEIPMYGAATLNRASQYLLLSFATFEVKFWMTMSLFILWFFCCGLPVILEQVLETFEEGTFAKQVSWTLSVSLFTNTLFVTLVESFLAFVACKYDIECSEIKQNLSMNLTSNLTTCPSAVLYDDNSIHCWDGRHKGMAVFGLIGLVWYSTTAIIFGTRYGDSDHPSLDLKFSPIYNVFINFAKALMVGVTVLAFTNSYVAFGGLILLNLAALIFTLQFRKCVGFNLSNSFVLIIWRIVSFVSATIAALSAVVAKIMNNPTSKVPLFIFLGGVVVVLVFAVAISIVRIVKRALTPVEHKRIEFRTCLKQLEDKLVRDNYMVNSWHKNRKGWRRLVRHVYEAQKKDGKNTPNGILGLTPEIQPPPFCDYQSRSRQSLPPDLGTFPAEAADNLPLPPTYHELFPNIMGPYDALPPPPPYLADHAQGATIPLNSPSSRESTPENSRPQLEKSFPGIPVENQAALKTMSEVRLAVGYGVSFEPQKNTKDNDDLPSLRGEQEVKVDIEIGFKGDGEDSQDSALKHSEVRGESSAEPREGIRVHSEEEGASKESSVHHSDENENENKSNGDIMFEGFREPGPSFEAQPPDLQDVSENEIDSILFLQSQFLTDEERPKKSDPVLALECNGKNLLLVLEEHIHYSAFSFAFITQLPMWRHSVETADWTQLVDCFRTLESNLSFTFNSPTRVDVACADKYVPLLQLEPDPDQVPPPVFIPEPSDPEEIRALAEAERSRCLQDIATLEPPGDKWTALFDKLLPTKPVLKKWFWDRDSHEFAIYFHRGSRGTLVDVGPRGLKLAKGASIFIPKILKGRFPSSTKITFQKGFQPKASKGPVGVTVSELEILELGEKTYFINQGKRLAFDKAMDCLYDVAWK